MASATREGVLNSRQLRFIDEYLVDFNATQAAIRSGYSKRTASEQGYELLRKPQIQEAIRAKQKETAHKMGVTRERVISELARIAFSDVRRLFADGGSLKKVGDLDDDTAGALASVEVVEMPDGESVLFTKKVKLWDKNSALEKLLKHLGMEDGAARGEQAPGVTVKLDFDAVMQKCQRQSQ